MRRFLLAFLAFSVALLALPRSGHAVELKVSRQALDRTLQQQLFSSADGRYYLKGDAKSACSVYAEKATLSFVQDRIFVTVKIHATLGTSLGGKCLGITLNPTAIVSMLPDAEGESIGFRDAKVEQISNSKELNFLLTPFLSHQVPSSMKVNAADILRQSLVGSAKTTGFDITLTRLKIHSMVIAGDNLVVDADGDLSLK